MTPSAFPHRYRRAAEQGHAGAEYNLGYLYREGKGVPQDNAEALSWFRKAADHGSADAQYALGVIYADGTGVPADNEAAASWFDAACRNGSRKACDVRR